MTNPLDTEVDKILHYLNAVGVKELVARHSDLRAGVWEFSMDALDQDWRECRLRVKVVFEGQNPMLVDAMAEFIDCDPDGEEVKREFELRDTRIEGATIIEQIMFFLGICTALYHEMAYENCRL